MSGQAPPELPCEDLVEVVTDYLEDQLAAAERARFDAHVAECPDCAEYLDQLRRTVAAVRRLGPEALDPEVLRALPAQPPRA